MSVALVHYETARRELAQAHRIDEVKKIRDKASAMAMYAKQAKDKQLEQYAKDIRERAEEKAGALLIKMAEKKQRHAGRGDQKTGSQSATPKLSDLGVNKTQSSRWQAKAKGNPAKAKPAKVIIANDFLNRASAFLRDFHWDLRNWLNEADAVAKDDQEALASGIRHIAVLFNDLASEVENIGGK